MSLRRRLLGVGMIVAGAAIVPLIAACAAVTLCGQRAEALSDRVYDWYIGAAMRVMREPKVQQ